MSWSVTLHDFWKDWLCQNCSQRKVQEYIINSNYLDNMRQKLEDERRRRKRWMRPIIAEKRMELDDLEDWEEINSNDCFMWKGKRSSNAFDPFFFSLPVKYDKKLLLSCKTQLVWWKTQLIWVFIWFFCFSLFRRIIPEIPTKIMERLWKMRSLGDSWREWNEMTFLDKKLKFWLKIRVY